MKQVFALSPEQFHVYLQQTISAHKHYRISFQKSDFQNFTLYSSSKAIVIDCHVVASDGSTELYLSATSPICVISRAHEQRLLADLLIQINQTIHHPPRPRNASALRHSSLLRGFRFLRKISVNF